MLALHHDNQTKQQLCFQEPPSLCTSRLGLESYALRAPEEAWRCRQCSNQCAERVAMHTAGGREHLLAYWTGLVTWGSTQTHSSPSAYHSSSSDL